MNRDEAFAEVKRVEDIERRVGFTKVADAMQFLLDENERLHKELALANARANRFAELINRNDE